MSEVALNNSIRSKFSRFMHDPRAQKAGRLLKENWREIASVIAVAYIMDDVDTAADMAEASFTLDLMTALSEGVIK